jgi:hypothetical protein
MAARKGEPHGQVNPKTGLVPRQELFCQYIVAGRTLAEATQLAGYQITEKAGATTKRDAEQAWAIRGTRIRKTPLVQARIGVLMAEQAEELSKQRSKLSDKFQMNLERLTEMLLQDREFARTGKLSLDPGAEIQPDHRPDARAAVQASMGLAKLHGLLIDKSEITVQGSITRMSNEELLTFINTVHQEIGPMIEVTAKEIAEAPKPTPRRLPKMKGNVSLDLEYDQ